MTKLLLSVHVLAAILTVGPIAVAGSLFPGYARRATTDGGDRVGITAVLHRVLPDQRRLLAHPSTDVTTRLTALTGVFNVLWAIVVVLMIVRPGSTTGA